MQDYKTRPRFLRRKTHPATNGLIALICGIVVGIVLALNI